MSCSKSIRASGLVALAAGWLACASLQSAPTTPPRLDPDLVQRGAALFASTALSGDGTRSCQGCHPGGGSDAKVYRNGEEVPATDEGARLTPPIRGVWQTAPYLWDGSLATIDEVVDRMLRVEMRGGSLVGRELEALRAYVLSIPVFDRGRLEPDGLPVEPSTLSARRGFDVFTEAGCPVCHPPPAFTRPMLFDIGSGGRFSVPTLRGVNASPPYGHDGRWSTLEEAIDEMLRLREIELTYDQRLQLMAYLELL